jgi:glycosyltransferase involved in cell wall biosynthesis
LSGIVLGVQGAQSATNRGRGIARYIEEQTAALAALAPERLAAVHLDPRLPPPPVIERLPAAIARLRGADRAAAEPGLYHVMSPFEEMALERLWPAWARGNEVGLVVTLYDLIPLVFDQTYLVTPPLRTYYRARLELLRSADAVLAISAAAAEDAVSLLGVDRDRLYNVSAGCSEGFAPAPPAADPLAEARQALPALRGPFLLYVGGLDVRKNLDRLLEAYARLPAARRASAQLIVASPPEHAHMGALRRLARRLGVEGDLLLTGFVTDELLLTLYRACLAHVMPSVYEGFGLPTLEAMRCGAAAVVSDIPSLRELVPDAEARFDPASVDSIAAVLQRLLDDPEYLARRRSRARELAAPHTWERVAAATLAAYDRVLERRAPATGSRKAS